MITSCPITIVVDHREQAPYSFDGCGDLYVIRSTLRTGDYSLPFCDGAVACSRKSLCDLYATVLSPERRARFERELARMAAMEAACVIVEQCWKSSEPPQGFTRRQREIVVQVVGRWAERRPTWRACAGRREAEVECFAFLVAAREGLARGE